MTRVGVVAALLGWQQGVIRMGVNQGLPASALCVLCESKRDVPLPVVGCQRTPYEAMALAAAPIFRRPEPGLRMLSGVRNAIAPSLQVAMKALKY